MLPLIDWIPRKGVVLALGLSAGITIGSLVLAPLVVARLPPDYFLEQPATPERAHTPHPLIHWTVLSLKNLLGVTLIVVGAALVPFPGQGLLTILVGLSLVDFAGKRRVMTRIGRMPLVLRSLNWVRIKAHRAPFVAPEAPAW